MGNIRAACTNTDFIDHPILPAAILLDDIDRFVVKLEETSEVLGPDYYSYLVYRYPSSHHVS